MKPGLLVSLVCFVLAACDTGTPTPANTQAPTQTTAAQRTTPGPATASVGPSISAGSTPGALPTPSGGGLAWTQLVQATAGPEARQDHTWTVIADVAYLFGGRTADGPANDL